MAKPEKFDPHQTWHRFTLNPLRIEPVPGVFHATRTQIRANNHHSHNCTYYRSEVFPTYLEAIQAAEIKLQDQRLKQEVIASNALQDIDDTDKQIDEARAKAKEIKDALREAEAFLASAQ